MGEELYKQGIYEKLKEKYSHTKLSVEESYEINKEIGDKMKKAKREYALKRF
jgi:hypothetical protein